MVRKHVAPSVGSWNCHWYIADYIWIIPIMYWIVVGWISYSLVIYPYYCPKYHHLISFMYRIALAMTTSIFLDQSLRIFLMFNRNGFCVPFRDFCIKYGCVHCQKIDWKLVTSKISSICSVYGIFTYKTGWFLGQILGFIGNGWLSLSL